MKNDWDFLLLQTRKKKTEIEYNGLHSISKLKPNTIGVTLPRK